MVAASPSPALSDESVGSEETAPMHYDFLLSALDLARGTQQPLPRQSARRYSMTTQHLELARLVDGPVWKECERLDDVGFTTVKVDPEVVAEEAVWCQAVECQIFTASLVPPTPCSTDSLSSTSPPFVFHAPSGELGVAARVSPAVDFQSLNPCPLSNPPDPLWSNSVCLDSARFFNIL
ncbi:unnamed protein product [Mesocestoides corti]|nr:unnamed protein product [Mesocestoides corti]